MLATQLRRRYEEVRSRAVAETLHTDLDLDTAEEEVTLILDIREAFIKKKHFLIDIRQ